MAPEPRIFSMPKTFELTNISFTVAQFILKSKNFAKRNGLTNQYDLRLGKY